MPDPVSPLAAYTTLASCGPGTRGGAYLRRFWHPIARVGDLAPGALRRIEVLGEALTLVRFADGEHALLDERCPHRGVALSLGEVRDDAVWCPYHGWRFDRTGRCVAAPGEPGGTCGAARARSRPIAVAFGLLFAWLGEGAPAPFPYADLLPPGMLAYRMAPILWPACFTLRLENTADFSHLQAAHEASGLAGFLPPAYRQTHTALPRGHRVVLSADTDPAGVVNEGALGHAMTWLLPNLFHYRQPLLEGAPWMQHLSWHTPATDDRCRTFTVVLVPGDDPAALAARHPEPRTPDTDVVARAEEVLSGRVRLSDLRGHPNLTEIEDCVMVVSQHRTGGVSPSTLGATDVGVASLRQRLGRDILASEGAGWVPGAIGEALRDVLVADSPLP
jgi:nitrite reductase/ring-hydroxylating ferredoxin subunit